MRDPLAAPDLKNIADFVLGTLCTLFAGYAIAYGQTPLFDVQGHFF